nr:hypothetical protein [Pseudomonas typographi]
MKRPLLGLAVLAWLMAAPLYAQNANNPYNSPIRNANPNSRQGTAPQAPTPRVGVPQPRQPTVQNGGIGNGENIRRSAPPATPPSLGPKRP